MVKRNFNEVIKHKRVTKGHLQRIINETLTISLPSFEEIWEIVGGADEKKREYTMGYSKLLGFQLQSPTVCRAIIDEIQEIYDTLPDTDFRGRLANCLSKFGGTPKIAFAHITDRYPDIILAAIEIKREAAE